MKGLNGVIKYCIRVSIEPLFETEIHSFKTLRDLRNDRKNRERQEEAAAGKQSTVQDCLVNFLQQPLPALTVESGGQQSLLDLLHHATGDGLMLTKGLEDFAWVMQFTESAHNWSVPKTPLPPQTLHHQPES